MGYQGRTKRQVENNYKITKFTFIIFVILIGIAAISKLLGLW